MSVSAGDLPDSVGNVAQGFLPNTGNVVCDCLFVFEMWACLWGVKWQCDDYVK
jgi:hypothetical protein